MLNLGETLDALTALAAGSEAEVAARLIAAHNAIVRDVTNVDPHNGK